MPMASHVIHTIHIVMVRFDVHKWNIFHIVVKEINVPHICIYISNLIFFKNSTVIDKVIDWFYYGFTFCGWTSWLDNKLI